MADGDRDPLRAVDEVGCGRSGGLAGQVEVPKKLAVRGIKGKEVAFAVAGKQHVGRRRDNSAVTDIGHFVLPDLRAGGEVEGTNGPIAGLGIAAR